MPTLLINWVFYNPVGHLVEAIQHAHGYQQANRDHFSIHLLLNAATPVELAEALRGSSGSMISTWQRSPPAAPRRPALQSFPATSTT